MQKAVHPPASPGPTESGLFDLLLMCLRHLRMLILLPVAVGAAIYGIALFLPQTYSSAAIIQLPANITRMTPQQIGAMLTSAVVLDPVIQQFHLADTKTLDRAREDLSDRVKAAVGREMLVRVEVLGRTPEDAQATARAVIESWLKSTAPSERELVDMKRRLEVAKQGFDNTQQALHFLTVENPALAGRRDNGTTLVALGQLADRYLDQTLNIPVDMQGLPREVVRQTPTLPTEPIRPRKAFLAIAAALLTVAAIMTALALRHLLDVAERIPARAERLRRLRAAVRRGVGRKDQDTIHA